MDTSFTKAFGLPKMRLVGENVQFEFRVEAYSLFNKINIDIESIDTNLGSMAPDGTATPNSGVSIAGNVFRSRTVQLQMRFSF